MGFKSIRVYWLIVLVALVPLLLAGCSRSATKEEPTETAGVEEAGETPVQIMPTTPAPTPDLQATADSALATEEAQQPVEATEPAPEPTPLPPEPEPTEEAAVEELMYVVLPGDTLFTIAQSYGLSVEELAARNDIIDVHELEVGQELTIPGMSTEAAEPEPGTGEQIHIVQPGQNLFRISLQYSMHYETVAAYNGISWPYWVYAGQEIRIPPAE